MVRGGELLAAPAGCPHQMYSLMRDCWKHAPQRRPNFEDIVNRIGDWIQQGGCGESTASECGSSRASGTSREQLERAPLLPPHASNGSLATGSLKKPSTSRFDDTRSTCSDLPPAVPRKKHSSGSLIDTEKVKETVVRIPNSQFGNVI